MRGESCLVFLERDSLEEYDAAMNTTETKIKFLFAPLFLILASGVAHAATEVTETRTGDLGRLYNGNEMLGVKPALGVINYNAADGSYTTRATYGLAGELNLAAPIGIDFTRYFVGVQTGAAYSHLGPSDSNFFGAGSEGNGGGANLLLIPANIKVAYSPLAALRVGAHGGANVIYRSIANSIAIDETDLNWRLTPNAGLDFDVAFSKGVSLSIRPDVTFAPVKNVYTASAALGIALN
jgi:hypothetical protein